MKETKITALEVLESFNREFTLADIFEVYKGVIAYNMGWTYIDEIREDMLNRAIDFYMDKDYIRGFLPEEVLDYVTELEQGIDPEPENER